MISLRHNAVLGRSLFSPSPLRDAIERDVDFEALYAGRIAVAFTLVNLSEGRVEVQGNRTAASPWELRQFSRAGYAVPLLHPPVKIRNDWYLSGAMAWGAAVDYAIRCGAKQIYSVQGLSNTPRPAQSLRFFGPVAARCAEVAWNLATSPRETHTLSPGAQSRQPVVTLLQPSDPFDSTSVRQTFRIDPRRTRRLIEQGYDDAAAVLQRLAREAGRTRKIVPLHAHAARAD